MRIVNNIAALNATNIKAKNTKALSKSIENLSSGLRINKAADDAAGLAISQKMRAQIRGLSQASRNAQDGISLIQTAEGAVGEMTDIAQRMRELCVQGANGTLTDEDRDKIQLELDSMKEELSSISNKTEFNQIPLLSGSINTITSVTKTNPIVEYTISVGSEIDFINGVVALTDGGFLAYGTMGKVAKYSSDGVHQWTTQVTGTEDVIELSDGSILCLGNGFKNDAIINFPNPGDLVHTYKTNIDKLNPDGSLDWSKNLSHLLSSTDDERPLSFTLTTDNNLVIVGVDMNSGVLPQPLNRQNPVIIKTDVDGNTINRLELTTADFDDYFAKASATHDGGAYAIGEVDNVYKIIKFDSSLNQQWSINTPELYKNITTTPDGGVIAVGGGTDSIIVKYDENGNEVWSKSYGGSGIDYAKNVKILSDGSILLSSYSSSNDGDITNDLGANENVWITHLLSNGELDWQLDTIGLNDGSPIGLSISNNTAFIATTNNVWPSIDTVTKVHLPIEVSNSTSGGIILQIGANAGQTISIDIDDMRPEALGFTNGMPRVNPIEMAGVSITLTDQAIMKLSSQRSTLGAYQNRLEHVIRNLDNSAENLQAAECRITDLDMAKGVSEMTKFNILSQAADAMIAQANQQPQGILQLLK